MDAPSLQNVTVTVKRNQLVAVVGPVGAGKVSAPRRAVSGFVAVSHVLCSSLQSSLLSTILGELPLDTGTLRVRGQLNYASQQPWVFPGTIRSNILFGRELDAKKYEQVLRACALKKVSVCCDGGTRSMR